MVDRSKSLRDSLVSSGLLSEDQVREAIEEGRRTNETLIKSILRKELVDENSLISFLEKEMEIPRVDLSSYLVDQKIVSLVPIAVAKKYKLIPLFKVGDVITVQAFQAKDGSHLASAGNVTLADGRKVFGGSGDAGSAPTK